MKPDYKLVAKAKYIHNTADLASELWHEVYKRYYPAKQLDTLVEELQSADAIEADIDNDVNYFWCFWGQAHRLLCVEDGEHRPAPDAPVPQAGVPRQGHRPGHRADLRAAGQGRGQRPGVVHHPRQGTAGAAVFKALRYRELRPAEQETGTVPRNELVYEHTLS